MQVSGEEQRHQHAGGGGGQTMSRNGSGVAAAAAAAGGSPASSEARSQSDGGAATAGSGGGAGHRLKIRLGGSSKSNRGTSVSSEGTNTNGPPTPRATTPVISAASPTTTTAAPARTNGHIEEYHQNGTVMDSRTNATSSREDVQPNPSPSAVPMALKQSSEGATGMQEHLNGKPMKNEHLAIAAEDDEETKKQREEQLQQDLAELPNVARQSLVPLYELVRRLVARSYTDLQSIVEVLPSQSDFDRKRTIIEYVIMTRRQIIKLLVLLRWAKDNTQDTERSINLIAFLQRQNYQLERAVQALRGVEDLLAGARVRNYDLITAVEVLTTGTYSQLPNLFHDSFIAPPKLTNEAVVTLLQELESVIRLRLQLYEHIPVQLLRRPYRIHDGRVTFHCPGYFKAAFTLGGDAPTDQWYLVDFSFDFKGRDVQQHPSGAMREHILQVCNTCLSEQAAKEKEEREKHTDHEVIYEKQGSAFIQTFKVLQDLCLNYQLELLHYHAIQTNNTPTIWQGMLAISLSKDRSTLEIRNQALTNVPPPPPHYGADLRYEEVITIAIVDQPSTRKAKSISTRLTQLAERFAAVGSAEAHGAVESSKAGANSGSSSPIDRALSCTFSREPMFIDFKGKKVPPPVQRKVDMRKVEYPVPVIEESAGRQSIRDFELVLGQCFSLKASMIPQNP